MKNKTKTQVFLTNIKLFLGVCIFLLLISELVCRVFFPDRRLRYADDEQLLMSFEPKQQGIVFLADGTPSEKYVINELGIRGKEISQLAKRKILFLGDSLTFGWGVSPSEGVVERLDKALGNDVSTVNAGFPGYGMWQVESFYERLAPRIAPELTALVIWQGSILRQPLSEDEKRIFLERSAKLKQLKKLSVFGTHMYRTAALLMMKYGRKDLVISLGKETPKNNIEEKFNAALEVDLQRITRMKGIADAHDSKFMIVFWSREPFSDRKEQKLTNQLVRKVRNLATTMDVPFVLLEKAYQGYDTSSLVIPGDGHPTSLAQCIAAAEVGKQLSVLGYPISDVDCDDELSSP